MSMVFESGSSTSIRRLCVRISKCSCESLSINAERRIVNRSSLVGKGTGPTTWAPRTLGCFDNPFGGLVEDTMVIRLEADADLLLCHVSSYSMILVMTPAPTVRPPSRMANFEPCSSATGTISSTVRFTLSPGITISTPSGRVMSPVTSIVRM